MSLTDTGRHRLQHVDGEPRVVLDPLLDGLLVHLEDTRVADRTHRGRANLVLEDRHLTEELTGLQRGELLVLAGVGRVDDLDLAGLDDVHAVAGRALGHDHLAIGEVLPR